MLKKYILTEKEHTIIYKLMQHPDVYPYVRYKAENFNEYMNNVAKFLESEARGEMVVRVIYNEWNKPIGMINLYDIQNNTGFLSTWIGKEYHGKGYNKIAKELFLNELFEETSVSKIYIKIRNENIRSKKAIVKLDYVNQVIDNFISVYDQKKNKHIIFDLFEIRKKTFVKYQLVNVDGQYLNNVQTKLSI